MGQTRNLWAEPHQLRGDNLMPGNVTTTKVDLTEFALRKWDGGQPIPAESVVTVIETRPYGSLLVAEMSPDAQAVTRKAIETIRADVARVRASVDAEEYADECSRLTRLTDRFPEPAEMAGGTFVTGREAVELHRRNPDAVLLKRVDGGQDREVDEDEAMAIIDVDPGAVYVALKITPSDEMRAAVLSAMEG